MAEGMTLSKATEVYRDILRCVKPGDPPEEHDALMLGIEAFNRIKHDRQVIQPKHILLLPGEAEE